MQSHPAVSAAISLADQTNADTAAGFGCIFRLRSGAAGWSALPLSARAALAAADAVLYDGNLDPRIFALVRHDAFVEAVTVGDGRMRISAAINRLRKLASEGWRVVWLASADIDQLPAACDGIGNSGAIHICTEICAHGERAHSTLARGPQSLATAFNGLAG